MRDTELIIFSAASEYQLNNLQDKPVRLRSGQVWGLTEYQITPSAGRGAKYFLLFQVNQFPTFRWR
jgi:hypothetical protein